MRLFSASLAILSLAAALPSSNAQGGTATLSWTAPGEDSLTGQAALYDFRYSLQPIPSLAAFNSATQVQGVPPPSPPGTRETLTVSGLVTNSTYYFAIRTADAAGNWSGMSNVWSKLALGTVVAPGGTATLSWTAPGEDSLTGQAALYDFRYSLQPIPSLAAFNSATRVQGVPPPSPPGTRETFTVSGLVTNSTYYFAIRTADAAGNWSGMSNVWSKRAVGTVDVAPGPPNVFEFSRPAPNPARVASAFAVSLAATAEVEIDVFDVAGRRVRALARGRWPAGVTNLKWDLRDDKGALVPSGAYPVRARLERAEFRRVVVVTR
jgi:hypothetical protein